MTLLLAGLALIFAGGLSAVIARRSAAAAMVAFQAFVVAGCALGIVAAANVLVSGTPVAMTIPASIPGGAWYFGVDALSAVFLIVILGVGAACAVFGTHDLARESRSPAIAQLAFTALVVSIAFVVTAGSVVGFLGAWEIMAISSYVLIVTHHEAADVRRAGLIYLVATHTATLALFAMFAAWAGDAPDWSFAALAAAAPGLDPRVVTAILLLALVGFGFKAGCVPFHFWLAPAHAAAPSHVSALMSGIVIKTGIYGLLRVLLLLGGAPAWWGWTVFFVGIASGILGVLWALAQHDYKRLLAYHSVENIGIILMGIGIGSLGVSHHAPVVAIVGFAGGLLHTVNHALFKSLLFLGAGSVYRATGTRNMEALGGLARRIPLTWLGFVVGAAAIIGVPPFNGFVSEWIVYQGMFAGADSGPALRMALVGLPALALIGALALACFAKVSGVIFLGTARSARGEDAREGPGAYVPILSLAAACVALGLAPAAGLALVRTAAGQLAGTPTDEMPAAVLAGATTLSLVGGVTILLVGVLWAARALASRRRAARPEVTWACGYLAVSPRMQYTASSFAAPLIATFGALSGVRTERAPAALHTRAADLVLDGAALPVWHFLHRFAVRLHAAQHGRLHVYLLYVMAALLAMLAYLALGVRP
ncbi:MAG: proton-conducting transporter membrane subunit [Gemmatimonadota bacterium]